MNFLKNKKVNIAIIIDDLFQIIPIKEDFTIEPLLEKVLRERKLFEGQDIFFVVGLDKIESILLSSDFASKTSDNSLRLSEKGILAKELGGLIPYKKYRQEQLGFNTHQKKINRWLIAATFLAVLSPIFVELTKKYWITNEPSNIKIVNPVQIADTLNIRSNTMNFGRMNDSGTIDKK